MATAKDLTITSWEKEKGDSPFTVAVPGLKITGWWPDAPPTLGVFDHLRDMWPGGLTSKFELDILEDADGRKHQICAYVRIYRYPESWLDFVSDSLKFFVQQGAAIAWAGGWECFLQYSAVERFAGCYAAYTAATGLVCAGDLEDPVEYLNQIPEAVDRLHCAVAQAVSSPKST